MRKDFALAEDMVAETYLRAKMWKRPGGEVEKELAYLYGVLKHVMADHYQEGKREVETVPLEDGEELSAVRGKEDRLEALDVVKGLLKVLSEGQRQVVILHKLYGLSIEEVVTQTGLSIHTVEKYVTQAMTRMRIEVGVFEGREIGHGAGKRDLGTAKKTACL
jgi:RNA polymerase sigma factor (sigma-70 family)